MFYPLNYGDVSEEGGVCWHANTFRAIGPHMRSIWGREPSIPCRPLDEQRKTVYANAMAKKAKTQKVHTGNGGHKYFADQMEDESVLFVFRKHPIVMRKGLIIAMLVLLIGPIYTVALTYLRPNDYPSMQFFFAALGVSAILSAIVFFPSWIGWFYSVFIVTDQRMLQITQKGLFHRSVVDIGLNQIQMVNYEIAGLQATMLGFGTIMMQTYLGDLVIHDVHHPAKIQKKLLGILRDQGVLATSLPPSQKLAQTQEPAPEDQAEGIDELVEEDEEA